MVASSTIQRLKDALLNNKYYVLYSSAGSRSGGYIVREIWKEIRK